MADRRAETTRNAVCTFCFRFWVIDDDEELCPGCTELLTVVWSEATPAPPDTQPSARCGAEMEE